MTYKAYTMVTVPHLQLRFTIACNYIYVDFENIYRILHEFLFIKNCYQTSSRI